MSEFAEHFSRIHYCNCTSSPAVMSAQQHITHISIFQHKQTWSVPFAVYISFYPCSTKMHSNVITLWFILSPWICQWHCDLWSFLNARVSTLSTDLIHHVLIATLAELGSATQHTEAGNGNCTRCVLVVQSLSEPRVQAVSGITQTHSHLHSVKSLMLFLFPLLSYYLILSLIAVLIFVGNRNDYRTSLCS